MNKGAYMQIKETLDQVGALIKSIQELCEKDYDESIISLTWDLGYMIENINQELIGSKKVVFCNLDELESRVTDFKYRKELVRAYSHWENRMCGVLKQRFQAENTWDEKFIKLMDYVQYVDFDIIVEKAKKSLLSQGPELVNKFCVYYQEYNEMWGLLDVDNSRYDVILNRVTVLKEHREDFIWLYNRLGDWRSKIVLCSMLYNWITFDLDYIDVMKERNFTDYYDLDLLKCDDQEVIVDLGAWIGDSVEGYISAYGRYKKIFCYEIDSSSMEEMKKNLSKYSDIEYRNKAAGCKNGRSSLVVCGPQSTINRVADGHTGKEIEIVTLDEDIREKITLIKMDIEGAEQDALLGCSRHIREEKPKLLISVYHNNEDIWKIPRIIYTMNKNYQVYLRSNGWQWGPAEIVLFAI